MSKLVLRPSENILLFYQEILKDNHHRYKSWEHCYSFFSDNHLHLLQNPDLLDTAYLHLAFYLASWGMYRGSSQLLQKDYRVHTRVVREILDDKYAALWNMEFESGIDEIPEIFLVLDLVKILRRMYIELGVSPTDTLITKVLLGTFGCIPAYDRFFSDGVIVWQTLPEKFGPKFPARLGLSSYRGLIEFYRQHKQGITLAQTTISQTGLKYPVMKLVDMYFWNLGYQLDISGDI